MKFGVAIRPTESSGGDYRLRASFAGWTQTDWPLRNDSGLIGMQRDWSRPGCLAATTGTRSFGTKAPTALEGTSPSVIGNDVCTKQANGRRKS